MANESTDRIDDTHEASHVVLRVPQAGFDGVLAALAGGGKLLSRKADAQDVTQQVVDVESRRHAAGERGPGPGADGACRSSAMWSSWKGN